MDYKHEDQLAKCDSQAREPEIEKWISKASTLDERGERNRLSTSNSIPA